MSSKPVAERSCFLVTVLLVAIATLGTGLRLYELDGDSLWYDEIFTAACSQQNLLAAVACTAADVNPPLMYIVTHSFLLFFGDGEFTLRLQAVLFGSLSVLLAYKVGEILWTRKEGLIGAFLLAANAYHVQYSQEARHYGLMVFLALLSLIFLLRALQGNRKWPWIGFVLCTTLGLYNHYFAFLFLPAEVAFAAWTITGNWVSYRRHRAHPVEVHPCATLSDPARQALALFLSLALVGLSLLPWAPALQNQALEQIGQEPVAVSTARFGFSLRLLSEVLTGYFGADGAPLLLWVVMMTLGLASSRPKHIVMLLLWMGAPFAFLAVFEPRHWVLPKYVLFILPLFLLATARGTAYLAALLDRALRGIKGDQKQFADMIVMLTVLVFGAVGVVPLSDYYLSQKEDWRSAARYLEGTMVRGDAVLVDAGNCWEDASYVDFCLSYYLSRGGVTGPALLQVGRQVWPDLESVGQHAENYWAVLLYPNRPASWDTVGEIAVIDFHQVRVIRLREPSGDTLEDTVSMLKVLSDLYSSSTDDASFDVHLALAEIYLRTGRLEQARSEIEIASKVKPRMPPASQHLSEVCAELERFSHPEQLEIPNPLWRNLGEAVALVGYKAYPATVRAGDTLEITLWWQALRTMDKDYTAFIHVLGPDDRLLAQTDRLLRQGRTGGCLTSTWAGGAAVTEKYDLRLGPDIPAGAYTVKVGIYYWETGERLPAWDETGRRVADDAILLQSIIVTE